MPNIKIENIEGIGPAYVQRLEAVGIVSSDDLLEAGRTPQGRTRLAELTGIGETRLLGWVRMVDLCRVTGVGPEYAELLEAAGVDTVLELRGRDPERLAARCAEVNAEKQLTRRVPSARVVGEWIQKAAELSPCVEQ